MSERNPKSKRDSSEFVDEALSSRVSPLRKKNKLDDDDDDSKNAVSSSSVASSVKSASVASAGEDDEEQSSECFSSETNEIANNARKLVVDLEDRQISEAETETSTFITSDLRRKGEGKPVETTETESSSATERNDRRKQSTVSKTPTPEEIDEFFSELENDDEQKRFVEKYNFDILNDKPLPGRFKWDPIH